jgi:hypothetical protein
VGIGVVVIIWLAVYRASRFITADTFPPVAWVRGKLTLKRMRATGQPPHWLVYLIGDNVDSGCPWCVSLWLGLGVGTWLWLGAHWQWWVAVAVWWSASAVTGLLTTLEARW